MNAQKTVEELNGEDYKKLGLCTRGCTTYGKRLKYSYENNVLHIKTLLSLNGINPPECDPPNIFCEVKHEYTSGQIISRKIRISPEEFQFETTHYLSFLEEKRHLFQAEVKKFIQSQIRSSKRSNEWYNSSWRSENIPGLPSFWFKCTIYPTPFLLLALTFLYPYFTLYDSSQ